MESESGQSDITTIDPTKRIIKYFSKCLIELINHAESIQYKSNKLVNYDVSSTMTYDSDNNIDITEHNIKAEITKEGPIFVQIERIKQYIVELLTICSQQNILIDYDTTKAHVAIYDGFDDSQRILVMNHLTLYVISIVESIYLSIKFFKSRHIDNGQQIKKAFASVYKEIKSLPLRPDITENMDSSFKSLTHKSEYKDSYNYLVEKLNILSKYICKFNKSYLKKCGYNDFVSTECSTDDDNTPRKKKKNKIVEKTYINPDIDVHKEQESVFKIPGTTENINSNIGNNTPKLSDESRKKAKHKINNTGVDTENNDNCETTNETDSLLNKLMNDTLNNLSADTDKKTKKKKKAKINLEQKIIDNSCNATANELISNTHQNQNTECNNMKNSLYESENEKNNENMNNSIPNNDFVKKNLMDENKEEEKVENSKMRTNNKENTQILKKRKLEAHLTSTETNTISNEIKEKINEEAVIINQKCNKEENKNDNKNLEISTQNNDSLGKKITDKKNVKNKEKEKVGISKKRKVNIKDKVENTLILKRRKLENRLTSTETNTISNDTEEKINEEAVDINQKCNKEENKNDNNNLEISTQNNKSLEKNLTDKKNIKNKGKVGIPKKSKMNNKDKVENTQILKKRKLENRLTSTETNTILNDTKEINSKNGNNVSHEENNYNMDEDKLSFLADHFLSPNGHDRFNDTNAGVEAENDFDDISVDVLSAISVEYNENGNDNKEFTDFTKVVRENNLNENERFLYIQDLIEEANGKIALSEEKRQKINNLNILVDWEICPAHLLCTNLSLGPTDEEKTLLKKLGVTTGRFTAKEDEIIQKNWKTFCQKHDLDEDPAPFLNLAYNNRKVLTYCERRKFLQHIGRGLSQRSLHSIFRRFKTLYKPKGKSGRFTAEEDDLILTYLKKVRREDCNQKFARLAPLINRDRMQIERRYRVLKQASEESSKKVYWTLELKEKFLKHLLEETQSKSIEDLRNKRINPDMYSLIGKLMNISPNKLRVLWTFRMHTELFTSEPINIDLVRIKIIKKIEELGYDDWKTIDWNRIRDMFDDGYTKSYVWAAFKTIIHDHVPSEIHKDLSACIDYLYEVYIPTLEEKSKPTILPRLQYENGTLTRYK